MMLWESRQRKRWAGKEKEVQTNPDLLIILFSKHLQFKLLEFVQNLIVTKVELSMPRRKAV